MIFYSVLNHSYAQERNLGILILLKELFMVYIMFFKPDRGKDFVVIKSKNIHKLSIPYCPMAHFLVYPNNSFAFVTLKFVTYFTNVVPMFFLNTRQK